jgi:phage tail tube protein FII
MPNPVMIMDYANLFAGSAPDDETYSNHLVLTEVKMPAFDVQYSDHRAAGAPIYIEISTGIARLECTFVCVGIVPQIMELIDSWIPTERNFFVYGNVRDQHSGDAVQAAAAFVGQIGRADPQNYRKGDVMHINFSIRNITHYEFGMAGGLSYYWDFFTNTRIIGGDNQNAEINTNLHVNSPAPEFMLTNFQIPLGGGA